LGIAEDQDIRPVIGDELCLRYRGELAKPWEAVGTVIKTPDRKFPVEVILIVL
jgi:hypothetical protein